MEQLVSYVRISRLMAYLQLTRGQRLLVQYFRRHTIDKADLKKSHIYRGLETDQILKDLNPRDNKVDKRILFELTGIKVNEDDYNDDSEFEDEPEESAFDRNVTSYDELAQN